MPGQYWAYASPALTPVVLAQGSAAPILLVHRALMGTMCIMARA